MHTTHFRKLAWLCMLFDIVKTNICNLNSGVINAPARRESWAVWNATTAHVSHAATLKSPQTVAARAMQTTLNIYGMYAFAHTHKYYELCSKYNTCISSVFMSAAEETVCSVLGSVRSTAGADQKRLTLIHLADSFTAQYRSTL